MPNGPPESLNTDTGVKQIHNYVLGCLLNLNTGEIRFTKNGEDFGVAFKLDQSRRSDCYFPAVVLKNAEISFNFGATPFKVSTRDVRLMLSM